MGFFTARRSGARNARPDLSSIQVPSQFEAVAEALAADADALTACAVAGHELARDGIDLGNALRGLEATWRSVLGTEPDFAATEAMSLAWSEETLGYLHQLSCEDELTGLASAAHLRARLGEVYRAAAHEGGIAGRSYALVVVELPSLADAGDPFSRALWLVRAAEDVRRAFPGEDVICSLGGTRLVVLTARDAGLGSRLARVRTHVSTGADVSGGARVWVESLPWTVSGVGWVLDELSRR